MRGKGAFAVVLLLFSGCMGSSSAPTGTGRSALSDAPQPRADADTGSISGRVVDDESVPLVNAVVTVQQTKASMQSDTRGNFTFNGLAPGTYVVFAEKLGYQAVGKSVVVKAGEVAQVNFILVPLEPTVVAYTASVPLSGYIQFGHAWTDYYGGWDLASQFCPKCEFYVHFKPNPVDLKFEASWKKPIDAPVISPEIYYLLRKAWNNDTLTSQEPSSASLTSGYWGYGPMPRNMETGDNTSAIKAIKNVKTMQVRLGGGFYGVAYEQRVDMWMSFTYNGPFEDDFSAFPKS